MSISVSGFKGSKNFLYNHKNKMELESKMLQAAKDSIYKDIASLISLSLARYKLTNCIKEALSISASDGSLQSFYRDFEKYDEYKEKLEPFYERMKSELTEENIFEFYKHAFRLSNEFDKEKPHQREFDISTRIVNVSAVEYPFKDYSIYQFFYGASKLTSKLEKSILKTKKLKSYYYFDHSDKPRNISHRLWVKRGKDWWNIINRSGSYFSWCPANGGITHKLFDYKNILLDIEEMKPYKYSIQECARILVKEDMMDELSDNHFKIKLKERKMTIEEYQKTSDLSLYTSSYLKARNEFLEMKENNDSKIINKEKEYIKLLKV